MRIATWNLERPRRADTRRVPRILERIGEVDADLWVLTETSDAIDLSATHVPFVSTLPEPYHSAGENWTTLWVRSCYPARQLPTCDSSRAVCAEIEVAGLRMVLYGTVLPWCGDGGEGWEKHYREIGSQGEDWRRLRVEMPDHRLCIAGDLNQSRDGRRWNGRLWYGTQQGRVLLGETLAAAGLTCVTEEDFVASGKLETRSSIDHVCLDLASAEGVSDVGAWEAGQAEGVRLSDHNGVFVDVQVGALEAGS